MENKLIYNFKDHGLYYKNISYDNKVKKVLLMMGTIELYFNYITSELLSVTGYLPLIKAIRKHIDMPDLIEQQFCISMKEITYSPGVGIDYFKYFEESKEYFMFDEYNPKLCYDEINKRILIGTQDDGDNCIKTNKNIICGLDEKSNLKYLLISLDEVIE